MQNQLHTDIRYLKGVGEKRAELFQRLGVDSIDALLLLPACLRGLEHNGFHCRRAVRRNLLCESDRIPHTIQAPDP